MNNHSYAWVRDVTCKDTRFLVIAFSFSDKVINKVIPNSRRDSTHRVLRKTNKQICQRPLVCALSLLPHCLVLFFASGSEGRANVAQSDVATEWEQRYFREQRKLAYSAEPKLRMSCGHSCHRKIRHSGKTRGGNKWGLSTIHGKLMIIRVSRMVCYGSNANWYGLVKTFLIFIINSKKVRTFATANRVPRKWFALLGYGSQTLINYLYV